MNIGAKEIKNDGCGYTCVCGVYHKFSSYVYAHTHIELTRTCVECGYQVTVYDCHAYSTDIGNDVKVGWANALGKPETAAKVKGFIDTTENLRPEDARRN